jgi:1,6-anhydro-N-acetylmuramate kinase
VGSESPQPTGARPADLAARAGAGVTRQVSRPHFEPAAPGGQTSVIEDEPALAVQTSVETAAEFEPHAVPAGPLGIPNRLIGLIAALTLVAFVLGFVVGLIVH